MILNLMHRYQDHYGCFEFQQEVAHKLGLKVTMFITSDLLCDEKKELLESFKRDSEKYGDELALWPKPYDSKLGGFPWLLTDEDKEKTLKYSIDDFEKYIGYKPKVIGMYVMDYKMMEFVRNYCPETTTVVAGCFEEGTKVYHGCNNSWFLFSEGMSWNPWYPSKTHTLRPAKSEDDWTGLVALPHLSRDLALAYEGRNDFFASHPANIQRGLVHLGAEHNYDFNLVDQYRMQEDFNDGFSYFQIHVSPSWLSLCSNVLDSDRITQDMYREELEYMKELKDSGELIDMTASEFGEYYKKNYPIEKPTVGVGKEMLYGSGKHYFWLFNAAFRVLVDTNQAGSIGDLRPYNGEFSAYTGIDSPMRDMHSYPYLIQSQIRTGIKTHCHDGSRTTLFVEADGESVDIGYIQSKIEKVEKDGYDVALTLTPITVKFENGARVVIQTVYKFTNDGEIRIARKILGKSGAEKVSFTEYFKGCYGFTEYGEDMKGIKLYADSEVLDYGYVGDVIKKADCKVVKAEIPQITTSVELKADSKIPCEGSVSDGHLFNPFYTLELKYDITDESECVTCLNITKI